MLSHLAKAETLLGLSIILTFLLVLDTGKISL